MVNSTHVEIRAPKDFIEPPGEINQGSVVAHFIEWVARAPERLALVEENRQFTYRELYENVIRAEKKLVDISGRKSEPVGILLGKESDAVVSVLATLKAGKFFAGLDPANPAQLLRVLCHDLGMKLLLTNSRYLKLATEIAGNDVEMLNLDELPEYQNIDDSNMAVPSDSLAGIYFTSGTTGQPKGAMIDHRAMWARVWNSCISLKFSPSDRVCLPLSVGIAWSLNTLFPPLVTGGILYLYDYAGKTAVQFADWLVANKITCAPIPPAFFRQFLSSLPEDYPSNFPDLRLIVLGGETFHPSELKIWQTRFSGNCYISNSLASTEAGPITRAFFSTQSTLLESKWAFRSPTFGVNILIRDEVGRLLKENATGEIVIRSAGIMSGYWKLDQLNTELFIADPETPQGKLLVTGDMGHLHEAGQLEFLGRKDDMVKIRGFRIQMEAIDIELQKLAGVKDGAATLHHLPGGEKRLVAFLVAEQTDRPPTSQLRSDLSRRLPGYMIPSIFIWVDSIPRTPLGKINRPELPSPSNLRPDIGTIYHPPRNAIEEQVALIWQKVLHIQPIGIEDNFFELGGDSLSALVMTLEVEKALSRKIHQSFFQQPTISLLSTLLRTDTPSENRRGKFLLSRNEKDRLETKPFGRNRKSFPTFGKLFVRRYSMEDVDKIVDWVVARYMLSLPYWEAVNWSLKWSSNPTVQRILYPRRYSLFSQFIAELNDCLAKPAEAFQINLLSNLGAGLGIYLSNKQRGIRGEAAALSRSRVRYWRSLGQIIESSPKDELINKFPIHGLENFLKAYQLGKGVIFLTFHGTDIPIGKLGLEKYIGEHAIPTISYHTPALQGGYGYNTDHLSHSVASSINSEIGLYAQRRLEEGGIIKIVGDGSDNHGRLYETILGGRVYQIKGGFAELALNTGSSIIPYSGGYTPDGMPFLNLDPPLESGKGNREEQVEQLIAGYADFINRLWTTHPEIIFWSRIRRHFTYPLSTSR